jgi:hypothetical protein
MKLSEQVAGLEARVAFDDECVKLLHMIKCRVFGEACYDPLNDSTQKFAAGLMEPVQALCDRLKLKF